MAEENDVACFSKKFTTITNQNPPVVYYDNKFGSLAHFVLLQQVAYGCVTELKVIRSRLSTYCTRIYEVEKPEELVCDL